MRAVISEQEVFDACNRVRALGQEPTTLNVYDALGKKGSYSTIGKHLSKWIATNPPLEPAGVRPVTPETLEQAALQFVAAIWHQPATDAAGAYSVERQALNQEVERWKNERDTLYKRLMDLDEEHDNILQEHEAALEEIERLKAENQRLQGERDALQNADARFRAIEEALSRLQSPA